MGKKNKKNYAGTLDKTSLNQTDIITVKNIFIQYCSYNLWATTFLVDTIKNLPEKVHQAEVKSSFPGLYKTLMHLLDVENNWWHRLNGNEKSGAYNKETSYQLSEVSTLLHQCQSRWLDWVLAIEEKDFYNQVNYKNLKGEPFKQPLYQILLHIFNHGTYHRGQLITILHQLNIQNIPQTDFIVWTRNKEFNK